MSLAITYLKVLNTKAIGGRNGDSPFIVGRPTPLMYVVLYYVIEVLRGQPVKLIQGVSTSTIQVY